ncbi:general substrate transporter [Cercophora samala]|uniref:General substrate transporter n=1 Tax=Cercophora samala TaxID=330535 RepID=A0AA39ZGC0_9PEZI|nr:general substrate transporter [Cercophora samala]
MVARTSSLLVRNTTLFITVIFATVSGILFGYDSGYINGVMAMDFFDNMHLSTLSLKATPARSSPQLLVTTRKDKVKLVGALSLGTFFGSFAGSDLADWVGRRTVLLLGTIFYTIGVLDQFLSNEINWLARGRFEAGIGMGAISAVVVVYLVETSRSDWRGWLVMIYQTAITLGMFVSSGVTFSTMSLWDMRSYQIPIGLQFVWVGLLFVLILFLPESPRWYVKTGQVDRARYTLSRLTGKPLGDEELEDEVGGMLEEVERDRKKFKWAQESPLGHSCEYTLRQAFFESWSCCWWGKASNPGSHFRRTLLATMIMIFQQLIGVNIVFYFAISVFKQHKFDHDPFRLALILAGVNVLSTLLCCYPVLALRRRVLLIGGALAMAVCQLTVGITTWTWYWSGDNKSAEHSPTWLLVLTMVGMGCYVIFFAGTWGPGAWILIGEIFPTQIRARAVGIATAANWATNSVICYLMPVLIEPDGRDIGLGVFTITGILSLFAAAYVYLCVPETEGKTLEELAFFFAHGPGYEMATAAHLDDDASSEAAVSPLTLIPSKGKKNTLS